MSLLFFALNSRTIIDNKKELNEIGIRRLHEILVTKRIHKQKPLNERHIIIHAQLQQILVRDRHNDVKALLASNLGVKALFQ